MKRRRLVCFLILVIMLFTNTVSVFADVDLSHIVDFNTLTEIIKLRQSSFSSKDDVRFFWQIYLKDIYPEYSRRFFPANYSDSNWAGKPMPFNTESVLSFNIFYYGWATAIAENKQHSSGMWLYLGATADGMPVTNIAHPESKMYKPTLILKGKYEGAKGKNVPYKGLVRPYTTNYSNPRKVGRMYLGADATDAECEQFGRLILTEWMKQSVIRDVGWGNVGKSLYDVFGGDLDKILQYATVTVPPTHRSNGQVVLWFEGHRPDGSFYQDHRTFYIKPNKDTNFKALDYTWDEATKTLTVRYEVEGLDKVSGYVDNFLFNGDYNFSDIPSTPFIDDYTIYFKEDNLVPTDVVGYYEFIDSTEKIEILHQLSSPVEEFDGKWYYFNDVIDEIKPALENGQIKRIYETKFDLSNLKDYREEDLLLTCRINADTFSIGYLFDGLYSGIGFPEYFEDAYLDNYIVITIPKTGLDFSITHEDGSTDKLVQALPEQDVEVPVTLKLTNAFFEETETEGETDPSSNNTTEDEYVTNVTIYDSYGDLIDTVKDIVFSKDEAVDNIVTKNITLSFPYNMLKDMMNNDEPLEFYAVINSNFDLTEATPVDKEGLDVLNNNKIRIEIEPIKPATDFSIHEVTPKKSVDKEQTPEVDLSFWVGLANTTETISTNVDLYKGSKKVDSQRITLTGGDRTKVTFNVDTNSLGDEEVEFYAVVNSNFNLTVATPYEDEEYLENNKAKTSVFAYEVPDYSSNCNFAGDAGYRYGVDRECVDWDYDEDYGWYCSRYEYYDVYAPLIREATLQYLEYDIRSNTWSNDRRGQEYGASMPDGKDLKGNPATDELMTLIGINPLKQVIRAGHGFELRGKIKLVGWFENYDAYSHSEIETLREYVKKNMFAFSKTLKMNTGDLVQSMEYDSSRASEEVAKIVDYPVIEYGNWETVEVFPTGFEFEIPVIISTASGELVNGHDVPNQRKWFVYINQPNGYYQVGLNTPMDASIFDVGGVSYCTIEPNNFRVAVYGTIFDIPNTDVEPDDPFWDN